MVTKKKYGIFKRTLVIAIVSSLILSMVPLNFSMAASSVIVEENLLKHSTFEETDVNLSTGLPADKFGNWYTYQGPAKVEGNAHEGNWSVMMSTAGQSLEQDVKNLQPGLTYEYAVWVKANDATKGALRLGVKNHGSSEARVTATSNDWKRYSLEFTSSTGRVRTYAWLESNTAGNNFYFDDATLTLKSDLKQVDVVNGMATAQFKDSFTGTPDQNVFEVTYSSSLDPNTILPVTITNSSFNANNKIFTMNFASFVAQPQAQTITMYVTYKKDNTNQTVTLDFPIEASGGEVITAKVQTLDSTNGTITATLNQAPTVAPVASDFAITYNINGGVYQNLITRDFVYAKNSFKSTFNFNQLPSAPTDQTVIVKVIYQGKETTSSFIIGVEDGVTYYVANTGSDSNNGLTPETAIQTIEKLNTITFKPGDHILFKKGDEFKGALKPIGSGTEGYPIVVASYGSEGGLRPVLKPSDTNWLAPLMSAEFNTTATVNNGISFYNQAYWEVRDLELSGPNHVPDQSVYRRGINITGEDAGNLNHFYFDNLIIHGFHGPNSNAGKSSGGILMEVLAKPNTPASTHIPTSINDIRITNSELYDLGRSGINFVSVWARRAETTDTKWGPYPSNHAPVRAGYAFKPYEDFYLANNLIYDIDGDGAIVDNNKNAVVENNLVYRTTKAAPYAVGLFNWNSDNTIFQFNEVYDILPGGDAQGIEIDALNDTTYVQYNYLHDNAGGTFMWCNTSGLYGFNGVFRYNISQNDNTEHGVIDWRDGSFGAQAYNNTIYMKEDGRKLFMYGSGGNSDAKFYNNIFYYPGDTPFEVNNFSENNIDWQNNLFYNFVKTPSNDSSVLTVDPMFVDPGKGGTGVGQPIAATSLVGYKLKPGSPAMNAGIPIANNGGRDYFNNPITGIPDIGAYDSGTISLNVGSTVYNVNQLLQTITIADTETLTVAALLSNLVHDDGIDVKVYRGTAELIGSDVFNTNDTLKVIKGIEELVYTISIVRDASSDTKDIPIDKLSATAGSWEANGGASEGPANLVLDNRSNTIWHSKWASDSRENLYITLALSDETYMVDGLRYQPRTGGGTNGIIKKYKLQYSNNGTDFIDIPGGTGDWSITGWQSVQFTPVAAKAIRLYAVDSISQENGKLFATAAEIRLTGYEKSSADITPPAAPSGVIVDEDSVTQNSVIVRWTPPVDDDVIGYKVYVNDGKTDVVIDVGNSDVTFTTVQGLNSGILYTFKVTAIDKARNESAKSSPASITIPDITTPTAPLNLAVSNVGETTATISWEASTDNVGVTGYEVYINDVLFSALTATSLNLTGLTANANNSVKVRAINANGIKSSFSSIVVTTTVASGETAGVLSGKQAVQLDEEFSVVFGLKNVTEVIFGQDVTFTYDPSKLELTSVTATNENFKIVNSNDDTTGQLRVLSAGLGSGITNDDTVTLTFRAKSIIGTPGTAVQAVNGTIANELGKETTVLDGVLNIIITDLPVTNPGDINQDGKYSIGDLALMAVGYGKKSTDADWDKYRNLDVNNDNEINIVDLAFVASKILGN
ncbi:fibronectin type III domain-containing protein [Paenibacillus antarcticus]|uniref:Probable pectate lyase C n=1 Tax=Paenibacillus antarcticus TaxID=253703 RepID=A0A168JBK7_9BACL|nr:fibronectin type III domain-containing protein [Paenibacillus antarcticus]OAB40408.1 hypothetical protein PBAT_24220 [Paenibacillus antarcticus]